MTQFCKCLMVCDFKDNISYFLRFQTSVLKTLVHSYAASRSSIYAGIICGQRHVLSVSMRVCVWVCERERRRLSAYTCVSTYVRVYTWEYTCEWEGKKKDVESFWYIATDVGAGSAVHCVRTCFLTTDLSLSRHCEKFFFKNTKNLTKYQNKV